MKKEIADKWTEALRSGKYKQGNSRLKKGDKFCCLGVLCDISKLSGWDRYNHYFNSIMALPTEVMDWAGMKTYNGTFKDKTFGGEIVLAALNDYGKPFNEIANIIEENWETL